ncbi:hypothetical protein [Flavobacterium sp. LC2016-01]|nr:hypothetical protein [Flavobacterium sp. LC2016-01]
MKYIIYKRKPVAGLLFEMMKEEMATVTGLKKNNKRLVYAIAKRT